MNTKEFEKTIRCEDLAKTSDNKRVILKSYLQMPIGKKTLQPAFFYVYLSISPVWQGSASLYRSKIKQGKKELIGLFKKIKRELSWEETSTSTKYFDEKNMPLETDDYDMPLEPSKVCIIEETTKRTIYKINKARLQEIKPFRDVNKEGE